MGGGGRHESLLSSRGNCASIGLSKNSTDLLRRLVSLTTLQTNCLSEIRFLEAEKDAKAVDDHFIRTGQTVGPLHGLPISMKDRFNIDGLETGCGYVSWLGQKKDSESEGTLVKILRRLGAIFFVKTNVPMSMLVSASSIEFLTAENSLIDCQLKMGETSNNIVGSTINPYNRHLSAGGASGGE